MRLDPHKFLAEQIVSAVIIDMNNQQFSNRSRKQ